jgi:pyruvate dehydrogenase E2 component (dihydrolipoamide acetyltransferase)
MPRLSDTMEEGTINAWLVADGAVVSSGEEIVEIEGDKATTAVEATADGPLKILQPEGTTLAVREPIAWIGADAPSVAEATPTATPPPATAAASAEPAAATGAPVGDGAHVGDAPTALAAVADGAAGARTANAAPPRVSPVARRLAEERVVDLSTVTGSGPGGRIVVADVEATQTARAEAGPRDAVSTAKGEPECLALSRTQELIARRMASAKATVPDFQAWIDVNMQQAIAVRDRLRAEAAPAPSLNDMIVRAVARSLREFPRVNGSYRDGGLELYPRINVAIAVASDDALYAPTIFDADSKSLAEIAAEARELTALGRSGKLTPAQTAGATFTVSNLGMFGVSGFRALVSPPQSAILAIGAIERRVVAIADAVAIRPCLTATLSIDHRIVYGAEAARFLAHLRTQLESPEESP